MIPILYPSTETEFINNGLGGLSDAISCNVIEELNGAYTLEMSYPINGIHYSDILIDRIVYAKPSDNEDPQPFDIYKISKPIDGIVTIYAKHVCYRLSCYPVLPFTSEAGISNALSALRQNTVADRDFPFTIDIIRITDNEKTFTNKVPKSFRECLGSGDESILGTFGGEVEWDKFNIKLHASRGSDKNIKIAYSKNLVKFKHDEDSSDKVTAIYPYWSDSNAENVIHGDIVYAIAEKGYRHVESETAPVWESNKYYKFTEQCITVSENTIVGEDTIVGYSESGPEYELIVEEPDDWSTNYSNYYIYYEIKYADDDAYTKIQPMNFTSYFEDTPTVEDLNNIAREYIEKNNIAKNSVSMDISFVALWQTEEYKNIAPLEHVILGDTVSAEVNPLGVQSKCRVIKTNYNVLSDMYDEISIGDAPNTLTETLTSISTKIESTTKTATYSLEATLKQQAELLRGTLGGYLYFETNGSNHPTGMYISSEPNTVDGLGNVIHPITGNVIRINNAGIYFSNNGYNGPFKSAWTIDGTFSADYIKAGEMNGDRIKAGTITADQISLKASASAEESDDSLYNFVRINGDGIEIGNSKSPVKLVEKNNMVYFTNKDETIKYAYISSDGFFTPMLKVTGPMRLLSYIITSEDGLVFRCL